MSVTPASRDAEFPLSVPRRSVFCQDSMSRPWRISQNTGRDFAHACAGARTCGAESRAWSCYLLGPRVGHRSALVAFARRDASSRTAPTGRTSAAGLESLTPGSELSRAWHGLRPPALSSSRLAKRLSRPGHKELLGPRLDLRASGLDLRASGCTLAAAPRPSWSCQRQRSYSAHRGYGRRSGRAAVRNLSERSRAIWRWSWALLSRAT